MRTNVIHERPTEYFQIYNTIYERREYTESRSRLFISRYIYQAALILIKILVRTWHRRADSRPTHNRYENATPSCCVISVVSVRPFEL